LRKASPLARPEEGEGGRGAAGDTTSSLLPPSLPPSPPPSSPPGRGNERERPRSVTPIYLGDSTLFYLRLYYKQTSGPLIYRQLLALFSLSTNKRAARIHSRELPRVATGELVGRRGWGEGGGWRVEGGGLGRLPAPGSTLFGELQRWDDRSFRALARSRFSPTKIHQSRVLSRFRNGAPRAGRTAF